MKIKTIILNFFFLNSFGKKISKFLWDLCSFPIIKKKKKNIYIRKKKLVVLTFKILFLNIKQ